MLPQKVPAGEGRPSYSWLEGGHRRPAYIKCGRTFPQSCAWSRVVGWWCREQKRETIRETNRKAHQQTDQLLTPVQREAYRRRIQERREEHRGRQRDGHRRDRQQPLSS